MRSSSALTSKSWSGSSLSRRPPLDCSESPPRAFQRGIEQFNEGDYFEAHETLEALWKSESGPVRNLLQGIIQLAVALHHVRRGNQKGALSLLERALVRLGPYQVCLGVDVAALREQAGRLAPRLRELGPDWLDDFPWDEAPRVALRDT